VYLAQRPAQPQRAQGAEARAGRGARRRALHHRDPTTAALQHPHILPLFDSGEADGFLFYVMPFIEGETLRAKLDRERQLGIDEALRITREVADALDYAHRHGVIHRDIKPENILLHDGRPVVADFGIALAVSAAAGGRMTETGLSLGTPHYMSPEQATADARSPRAATSTRWAACSTRCSRATRRTRAPRRSRSS
jgi:serine/threonine protein kinase